MKKFIFLITIFLSSLNLYSQNSDLKETQDWIKEKIQLYQYQDNGETKYRYKISFDETSILIEESLTLKVLKDPMIKKIIIPIKNLMQIRFEEKESTIWLIFTIRDNAKEISNYRSIYGTKFDSTAQIILSKSIDDEELRPRLIKAFNHLVELYGGKTVKEKF